MSLCWIVCHHVSIGRENGRTPGAGLRILPRNEATDLLMAECDTAQQSMR
jgi:hypothetical protein